MPQSAERLTRFQLRLWSQGRGIQPHIGLCAQRFILPPLLLPLLSSSKINKNKIKKLLNLSLNLTEPEKPDGYEQEKYPRNSLQE